MNNIFVLFTVKLLQEPELQLKLFFSDSKNVNKNKRESIHYRHSILQPFVHILRYSWTNSNTYLVQNGTFLISDVFHFILILYLLQQNKNSANEWMNRTEWKVQQVCNFLNDVQNIRVCCSLTVLCVQWVSKQLNFSCRIWFGLNLRGRSWNSWLFIMKNPHTKKYILELDAAVRQRLKYFIKKKCKRQLFQDMRRAQTITEFFKALLLLYDLYVVV